MTDEPFKSQLDEANQTLSEIYDGHHLTGFRDDIEQIWVENRADRSWDIDSKEVAGEVRSAIEYPRRQLLSIEEGINKLLILDGVTGGIVAYAIYHILTFLGFTQIPAAVTSVLVFLFFTLTNRSILYKKAIINRACYLRASPREAGSRLLFKRGWNYAVLSSNSLMVCVLLVALFRRVWVDGYNGGLVVIRKKDKEINC